MGTYTANYNLYMPTVGETGWGTLINGNYQTIDTTMKGLDTRLMETEAVIPPIGTIMPYAGGTAPTNRWLICNGQAVSRTTYAKLYSVIGTKYGIGNGSTTFNLPNLAGRVPIGVSSSHALGTTGGAETHTLTINEMPSHNHSATGWLSESGGNTFARRATSSSSGTLYTNNTGGGQAHNNMQPYITLNYLIRAL